MSVDFSKHPIYFFDDDDKNYDGNFVRDFRNHGRHAVPPITFVHIKGGQEMQLPDVFEEGGVPPALLEGAYYAGAGFLLDRLDDALRPNLDECFPYIRDGASKGHPLALVFDWDKTITLRNGGYNGGMSLDAQAKQFGWDAKKLARWYLHDPDDATRIENLSSFFRAAQTAEVPIFILTKNPLGKSNMYGGNPKLLSDILKEGLNLGRAPVPPQNIIWSNTKTPSIIYNIIPNYLRARVESLRTKHRLEMENAQAAAGGRKTPPSSGAASAAAYPLSPAKPPKESGALGGVARALGGVARALGGRAAVTSAAAAGEEKGGGDDQRQRGKGRKTRRRKRKKRKRRRRRTRRRHRNDFDKELKRVIAQHRRYQIARGDKRFKATKRLVKWSRPNKTKRKNRVYYRKRKSRKKR